MRKVTRGALVAALAAAVVLLALWAGGEQGSADLDPPGPPELDDQVRLDSLVASTDQDDWFNGESEYCIRLKLTHLKHEHVNTEFVNCFSANWDSIDPATGKSYDDPIHRTGIENAGNMPLMGPNGIGGGAFNAAWCNECAPTEQWTLQIQLTESDFNLLGQILKDVGTALQKAGLPVAVKDQGRLVLVGTAAKLVGEILDKLFAKVENLGVSNPTWAPGAGDPQGQIPKAESPYHYSYNATKTVKQSTLQRCGDPDPPAPAPTPLPPGSPAACLSDERHLFSRSVVVADGSWERLRGAASRIDDVTGEGGEPLADEEGVREDLRELTGTLGRFVAQSELSEAAATLPPEAFQPARHHLDQGDFLLNQALSTRATEPLLGALDEYRQVFSLLAPQLHPECNLPVGGMVELLVDSSGSPARVSEGGGAASFPFPAIAGTAAAAGALALVAGGWYARRRFSKG